MEPKLEISDDGSQSFTCSIPKFYIDKATNSKIENPRWLDIKNGVLAENTRILKVFIQFNNEIKIFPFIIDKIIDKRDSHFAVYKQIEATGLAFQELGKIGYKIEMSDSVINKDYENNNKLILNLDYWLDKVFPNEKDSNGKIIKWLTPWCYEINMDWSNYVDEKRLSTKMYEDSYVSSWGIQRGTIDNNGNALTADQLVSKEITTSLEKSRKIDSKNSNKYNLTQTIAETFGVFCAYEYKCDQKGFFVKEYTDTNNNIWTGKKVVFYNRAIDLNNPFFINYQDNLDSIKRTKDGSEIYSKLYITPIQSTEMEEGYVSIANTSINPLLDDFILNFDYLYNLGSITDYQMNFINSYKVKMHEINNQLMNLSPQIDNLVAEVNNLSAEISFQEKEISSTKETYQTYRKLRDNEGISGVIEKNKNNSYSIIFVKAENHSIAQMRLQGIDLSTIKGYSDSTYTEPPLFTSSDLISINSIEEIPENSTSIYAILDEYGYPTSLCTSSSNTYLLGDSGTAIIYLSLSYSPKNAYNDICNSLINQITNYNNKKDLLDNNLKKLEKELEKLELLQETLLKEKEDWNQKLELKLGPALREGYWTPDSYEDPGYTSTYENIILQNINVLDDEVVFKFDSQYFDNEEKGYYYSSIEDESEDKRTFYPYIDISEYINDTGINNLIEGTEFLSFKHDGPLYVIPEGSIIEAGTYHLLVGGKDKYFTIPEDLTFGSTIQLKYSHIGYNQFLLCVFINGELINSVYDDIDKTNVKEINPVLLPESKTFEDFLYNNAGFIFTFITENNLKVKPIILITDTSLNFDSYDYIGWYTTTKVVTDNYVIHYPIFENIKDKINRTNEEYELRYPRLILNISNVKYNSDQLTIFVNNYQLEKYKDYQFLLREGRPHFTLKITNNNTMWSILESSYKITYQVSRAHEMLYLDAKEVAYDNSQPKYSYELNVSNTPDNIQFLSLGQLCYINDASLNIHSTTGYISSITYELNNPQSDKISIKNYKTKFEDLFGTITASSETVKNNQIAYNIAAQSFNSDGTLQNSVLQDSIDKNTLAINYSDTNVTIDDTNGILLTNNKPYTNGVYGQIMLQGGGIFLSSNIDGSGGRIWSTGITPSGINASLLTAGQLDTDVIRIFSGNNVAFQWNGEGIFAFKKNKDNIDLNTYVHYSDKGLQFIANNQIVVDLGWNGLLISTQNGSTELTGEQGLTIYDGEKRYKDGQVYNHVVRLGGFDDNNNYGLKLYRQKSNDEYVENLIMTNHGELWLKDELIVGTYELNEDGSQNIAGISGDYNSLNNSSSVRFWAGRESDYKNIAPFRVQQDGTLYAQKAIIKGDIQADSGYFSGELRASEGTIGGWLISENALTSKDGYTNLYSENNDNNDNQRININDNFIVKADGTLYANEAVIKGTIEATGGNIGNLKIEDITSSIENINANKNNITVEIVSNNGSITKKGVLFNTTLTAIIKKGDFTITEEEYSNYQFQWQYSDDGEEWFDIYDDSIIEGNIMLYEATLYAQRYLRCIVTTEVADNGD